jgi:spore coat protein CotH|tara:strand:+ start:247 stop:417 length:171 start_codon:yes stop_codon:yes gene_type:complete
MSESNNSSIDKLEEKINTLIKRFDEQKGIIDSYIKREREWKKDKLLLNKQIKKLNK